MGLELLSYLSRNMDSWPNGLGSNLTEITPQVHTVLISPLDCRKGFLRLYQHFHTKTISSHVVGTEGLELFQLTVSLT